MVLSHSEGLARDASRPLACGRWTLLVSAAAFLVLFIALGWGIWKGPLARTEPHRVIPAQEMAATGDWLVPRLYGRPYLRKPPAQYWSLATAQIVTGSTEEWVYRLPSVIWTALTAAVVAGVTARWFGRMPGLIAGASMLALLALWSQARGADIDALNTFAAVLGGLAILEFGRMDRPWRFVWALLIAVASVLVFLAKGPAGLPVMIGAIAGSAVAQRKWSWSRHGMSVVLIALGASALVWWGIAVKAKLAAEGTEAGFSGAGEVARNLSAFDLPSIFKAATLPVVLLVIAIPVSIALPLAMGPAMRALAPPRAMIVRGVVWTLAFTALIGVLARTTNARYMYIALPMLCPLVGAVALTWRRGGFGPRMQMRLRQVMTILTAGLLVAVGILGVRVLIEGNEIILPLVFLLMAVAAGAWALRRWIAEEVRPGTIGLVVVLMLGSMLYAEHVELKRGEISSRDAGAVLAERLQGEPVISGLWIMNGPELFLYAGAEVEYPVFDLTSLDPLPPNRWIVFRDDEWAHFKARSGELFSSVETLPTRSNNAILARTKEVGADAG